MRLTQFTDLALRLMVYLASHQGERITIAQAADSCGVSRFHLMKVSSHLARRGLVRATKGRTGSVSLGRAAEEIFVGTIVRAAEDDFDLVECQAGSRCTMLPTCRIPLVLEEAMLAFFAHLDACSLAELAAATKSKELP
jgi:Rrf2 family nitric oxide-sensitive transcriptional repressor